MQIKQRCTGKVLKEIEGEKLSGADLSGADLSGEKLKSTPVSIYWLTWIVVVTNEFMTIGCQRHSHAEWAEFSDATIGDMESRALEFWIKWKAPLLSICAAQSAAK